MIEILPAPEHVAAFRMEGRLTADDYGRLAAHIDAKLAANPIVHVYADATLFDDITPEALAKDFAYSFGKITDWPRFRRAALVTDKGWMKLLVKATAPFVPTIDYRVFGPGEQAEALTWASTAPDKA